MTYTETALRFTGLPPAEPLPFAAMGVGSQLLVAGAGVYMGHAIEETTGAAAARLVVSDGNAGAAQRQLAPLTVSAGESRIDYFPQPGVSFSSGMRLDVTAGSVAGVLYVVLLSPQEFTALMTAGLYEQISGLPQ